MSEELKLNLLSGQVVTLGTIMTGEKQQDQQQRHRSSVCSNQTQPE